MSLDWTRQCVYFLYPSLGGLVDKAGALQKHDITPAMSLNPVCSSAPKTFYSLSLILTGFLSIQSSVAPVFGTLP